MNKINNHENINNAIETHRIYEKIIKKSLKIENEYLKKKSTVICY